MKKLLIAAALFFACTVAACAPSEHESVYSVSLSESSLTLIANDASLGSAKLAADVLCDGVKADTVPTFTVSDPSVAAVDETGTVTAKARGRAVVTATCKSASASAEILVYEDATEEEVSSFGETFLNSFGRTYLKDGALHLDNVAAGVEVSFYGSALTANVAVDEQAYARVYIDGKEGEFAPVETEPALVLAEGLEEGVHTVRVVKASEVDRGALIFHSFSAERFLAMPEPSGPKIEFIGDSITAGYGNLVTGGQWSIDNSDGCSSYAYLTAKALDADYSIVALSGLCVKAYRWSNDMNMETMHPYVSLRNREPWTFDAETEIVVLALGTNDGSYLDVDHSYRKQFPADYAAFLTHLRTVYPNADIVCIYGMMGTVEEISNGIHTAIEQLGDEKITYLGFRKNDAGANGHPNAAAHKSYAKILTDYLTELL